MNNDFDDFFSSTNNTEVASVSNAPITENKKKKFNFDFDIKNDKVLLIQLVLFGVWVLLTVIIYFFGYNLFEPFIKI